MGAVRRRAYILLGLLDKEVVEKEAEVDTEFLKEFLALNMSNLYRLVDGTRVNIGAEDLFPEHFRIQLNLRLGPLNEACRDVSTYVRRTRDL